MLEHLTHLITPCCKETKLNQITNSQLSTQAPLTTILYTQGDYALTDLLTWLIVRFPSSAMTIIAPAALSPDLTDCLHRFLTRTYNADTQTYYINSLHLYTPPADFTSTPVNGSASAISTQSPSDFTSPRIHHHATKPHTLPLTILIESFKGSALIQGTWPILPQSNATLAEFGALTYTNSPKLIDHLKQILPLLTKRTNN